MNSNHPLFQLTRARLLIFVRDPSALFWTFGFPILLSIALGIAFRSRPPEPVTAAVEEGPRAEELARALSKNGEVKVNVLDSDEAARALRVGRVSLVVLPTEPVTYRFDPTRPESRLARMVIDSQLQLAAGRVDPAPIQEEIVSEPGARYIDFLIPGLIGLNIMQSGLWGIGWGIVETRTQKLLKRMVATPMRRRHFLLSFVLMRMVWLLMELPVLLLFGALAFGIPLRGSLLLLGATSILGALAFSGIGLLVASRARNTQTVTGLINLVMLPMFIGSGVFFSTANFPDAVQPVIKLLPLTALNEALRGIMNEGAGLVALLPQIGLLAGIAAITFGVALRVFRWN